VRPELFAELAPVCPRCLHGDGTEAPLTIAETFEERGGLIWHGLVHCSNRACWMEFPVIDGVPVIVPDPPGFLTNARNHVLARDDLPAGLDSVIGDALGPGSEFDTTRQHLNLYARGHFADWTAEAVPSQIAAIMAAGMDALGEPGDGPAIDLGTGVGRGAWELAARTGGPVVGADLNFSMLRLAQSLMLEGRARFGRRRVGIVYDPVEIVLPAGAASERVDFWAMDCMALPFTGATFTTATALNVVDCIAGPTNMIAETARVLAPGGGALITPPYDWSNAATEPAAWMGGHSQRGPLGGAAEPVLTATLAQAGLAVTAERHDVPWELAIHARSVMTYRLHMVACRRDP